MSPLILLELTFRCDTESKSVTDSHKTRRMILCWL